MSQPCSPIAGATRILYQVALFIVFNGDFAKMAQSKMWRRGRLLLQLRERLDMYIRTKDNKHLINFDNFHEIMIDEENLTLYAVYYCCGDKKIVTLGQFKTLGELQKEYDDLEDSLCDDDVAIFMVE